MCFLKPLKVKRIKKDSVILENNLKALYDKRVGKIKPQDTVLVFGNLIIQKVNGPIN